MQEHSSVLRVRQAVRAVLSYLLIVASLIVTMLIIALW